jgi:hypothetical protein
MIDIVDKITVISAGKYDAEVITGAKIRMMRIVTTEKCKEREIKRLTDKPELKLKLTD